MDRDQGWLAKCENKFRGKNVLEMGSGLGEYTRYLIN
jgi:hypothetical protein